MRYSIAKTVLALFLVCGMVAAGSAARAQNVETDAGAFISRLGQRTISYLKDAKVSRGIRKERLRGLLRDGFAVEAIGRFVLGKYRRGTSPDVVDEFVEVFEDYIVGTYANQFSRYSGERFDVKKVLKTTNARDTMVMTHISGENSPEPLRVDFQVRKQQDTFKIVDIRVEGVSMVLAQRDEFTSFITKNGGDVRALINALKKRSALAATPGAR